MVTDSPVVAGLVIDCSLLCMGSSQLVRVVQPLSQPLVILIMMGCWKLAVANAELYINKIR